MKRIKELISKKAVKDILWAIPLVAAYIGLFWVAPYYSDGVETVKQWLLLVLEVHAACAVVVSIVASAIYFISRRG